MFCLPISDHLMFSWEFSFYFSILSYAYICMSIRQHLKEAIQWGSITLCEMGKQHVQAKKLYLPHSSHDTL